MRRAAASAALVLVVAGCGGGDRRAGPGPVPTATETPAPEPKVTDADRLRDLLARRAEALEDGRPAAYGRTSGGARARADRRAARRARALGLRHIRLEVEEAAIDGRRARLRVRLTYRVRGVGGVFGGARTLRATQSGAARWRITGPLPARGRAPWEADAYRRTTTPHFVVWMPQDLDAGPLPAALEDGYARMRDALEAGRLRERYLVVVARDAAVARRMTGSIDGLEGLTALTDTEVRQVGESMRVVEVASQRLLVVWPNFTPLDPEAQRITVAHELTHAALAPVTSGRTPGWLTEGLALYVSEDRRTTEAGQLLGVRAGGRALSLRALSAPAAFGRLGGQAQRAAYAYASAAAFHIAERYGREALIDLYAAFNRSGLRGAAGDPALTDAATRRILGVTLRRLERDVRAAISPL